MVTTGISQIGTAASMNAKNKANAEFVNAMYPDKKWIPGSTEYMANELVPSGDVQSASKSVSTESGITSPEQQITQESAFSVNNSLEAEYTNDTPVNTEGLNKFFKSWDSKGMNKPQLSKTIPTNKDLGWRNNNPGNLRSASTGKMRTFNTLKEGQDAIINDLYHKAFKDGLKSTVVGPADSAQHVLEIYNSKEEGNTPEQYALEALKRAGVDPKVPFGSLSKDEIKRVAKAMIAIESPNSYIALYGKEAN
jgi:hypothetical protein